MKFFTFMPAVVSMMSIIMLTSCQKEFVRPEPIVEVPKAPYIPDSLKINFIWAQPDASWGIMVGARYEIRDINDSLLVGGVDVMTPNDSLFQWYPAINLKNDLYHLYIKSPTGQLLASKTLHLEDSGYNDEWFVGDSLFNYYIQITWKEEPIE